MHEHEVNKLMDPDSRAALDEDKERATLLVKLNIFDVAFHNLEAVCMDQIVVDGNYQFIPFPCGAFVDMLMNAYVLLGHDRSKKFLDVGCGIGTKVILACSLMDGYGIDYNEQYVNKANTLGLNRVGLADGLLFDKYNQFDLIYYYRPIQDTERYLALESKIHKEMKSGTLVAPMDTAYNWDEQADIEKCGQFLYRKK